MADPKIKTVVLDTDIGPDCDDAGAILMLLNMEKAGLCRIAAITCCTSSRYGPGCIDAICAFEGRPDIPIGALARPGVLAGPADERYNSVLTEKYENRYRETPPENAVRTLRRAFAENDEVLLITIGPFGNLADFLESGPDDLSPLSGAELAKKNPLLVSMGGMFKPGNREFNFFVEAERTAAALGLWPGEIAFSLFETGADVISGADINAVLGPEHPVALAYTIYAPEGRSSFDHTAVHWAILPDAGIFRGGDRGRMSVDPKTGENFWDFDPAGPHCCFEKAVSPEKAAAEMEKWMYYGAKSE